MMSPKSDIRGLPGGRILATSAVKGLTDLKEVYNNINVEKYAA